MLNRRSAIAALLAAGAALSVGRVAANPWQPSRPVVIVVPFPAGGLLDAIARHVGNRLSSVYDVPVIVENRPGANTMIGAAAVSKAAPDGHTLLFTTDASLTISPFLYTKMTYDAEKDFAPVTLITETVNSLIVHEDVPAGNLKEFLDYAKKSGPALAYGTFGPGSNAHLSTAEIEQLIGVTLNHVPYKGQSELYHALIKNEIQFMIGTTGIATPYIERGQLKVLAVLRERRGPQFPDVPTSVEEGYPSLVGGAWFGFLAPAGTPAGSIERHATEILKVVTDREFQDSMLTRYGLELAREQGPAAMAGRLTEGRAYYKALIEHLQLRLD